MSIVKRHDVIQTSLLLKSANKDLAKLEEDKHAWSDMEWQERNIILKKLHAKEVNAVRQPANLAIDHQKMLKAEFTETLTTEMGDKTKQGFLSGKGKKMTFREEPEGGEDDPQPAPTADQYSQVFFLNPNELAGFEALKSKYQYFKINKISVKFVANTANNLSPIICRYLPPLSKVDNLEALDKANIDSSFITKVAESAGTNYGFLSIHCPPCLVKIGEYKENADKEKVFSFGENGFCLPNLCKDRCITDFKDYNQYLDYGYLYFETRNEAKYQSVVIQLHYYIDFYTGYDYEAASIGASFGPGAEEGGDDPLDPTDPNHKKEEDIPDSTPKGPGLHPRGGVVKKSFKK